MNTRRSWAGRALADYGIVVALVALCAAFSAATFREQPIEGADAGEKLAARLLREYGPGTTVLIAANPGHQDGLFAEALDRSLTKVGVTVRARVAGHPSEVRKELDRLAKAGTPPTVIAASAAARKWSLFENLAAKVPGAGSPRVVSLDPYRWPTFLKASNLLNIANQIAVIAILAAGMTLVVLTGGIDLSVGSLVALSAVVSALLIRDYAGATQATAAGMVLACAVGVAVCGCVGALTGVAVTRFAVPPFIVTLGVMLMARGAAGMLSQSQSVYQLPDSFVWLGVGADLFGVPNAVVLMLVLYAVAHVVTTRTAFGRYVYAVGGNAEAARLAGVRVGAVVVAVYALSGLLAGLGGVVLASQLKSGAPTYGEVYELYVIAAVVVGGTSLAGGEGRVLGTLAGALVIAVIQNGMNLTGIESNAQRVVLGAIIVGAVLLDRRRKRGHG